MTGLQRIPKFGTSGFSYKLHFKNTDKAMSNLFVDPNCVYGFFSGAEWHEFNYWKKSGGMIIHSPNLWRLY